MCEHLIGLDQELKLSGFKETYRGQAWSNNCREWVYYDCVLHSTSIRKWLNLRDFIVDHSNDDPKSGLEAGLVCEQCHDAVIGVHPSSASGKKVFQ